MLGRFVGGMPPPHSSPPVWRPGRARVTGDPVPTGRLYYQRRRVWAASTAAGPAFEGQGITWGMRAAPGAITGVKIDGTGWQLETLGGVAPLGITGSGLIALVAAFLALGLLTPEGRLKSPGEMADLPEVLRERLQAGANGQEVLIDKESGVTITQKDIRLCNWPKGGAGGSRLPAGRGGGGPGRIGYHHAGRCFRQA